jgi:hypothetical protein
MPVQRGSDGRFERNEGDDAFVVVTNADIYRKLEEMADKLDPLPAMVQDHENRLRTLEGSLSRVVGAVSLVAPVVGVVSGIVGAIAYLHH